MRPHSLIYIPNTNMYITGSWNHCFEYFIYLPGDSNKWQIYICMGIFFIRESTKHDPSVYGAPGTCLRMDDVVFTVILSITHTHTQLTSQTSYCTAYRVRAVHSP